MERLQRVLAEHGVASRRKAEELIVAGRVTVDGQVVQELGVRVDPERQDVRVDGQRLRPEPRRYIMLNKPPGYITTMRDERDRRTVMDLVDVRERVVPVGRLDRQTAGLLLLTNDGEVAFRVTHPRYELEKEYEALVDGFPPPAALETLRRGVTIDGERVVPDQVRPLRNEEAGTVLRIVIHEGRNRIVRRMLDRIGYPVVKLVRTRIGPLHVRGLAVGAWRDLTPGELTQLREALRMDDEDVREPGRRPRPDRREPEPPPRRGVDRSPGPPGADRPGRGRAPAPRGERPARPPQRRGEGGRPPRRDDRPGRPERGWDDRRQRDERRGGPERPPRDRDRRPGPADGDGAPRRARPPREADTAPADRRQTRRGPGGRPPTGGRSGKPGTRRGGTGAGQRTYGRKRGSTGQAGKPAGNRDRRPGGGRQDNRGQRRRPPA